MMMMMMMIVNVNYDNFFTMYALILLVSNAAKLADNDSVRAKGRP